MAGQGRPKKPDRLKVLQGTFQRCRSNPLEPIPAGGAPSCPAWLDPEARAVWKRTVAALAGTGLLTKADGAILTQYAMSVAIYERAAKEFSENPMLTVTTFSANGSGEEQNPLLVIMRQYAVVIRPMIAALGLSPLDRPKLQAPPKPENKKGFEAFK